MPFVLVGPLVITLICAVLALALGLLTDAAIGWAVFAGTVLLQLAYHLYFFARLDRWSRQPSLDQDQAGKGAWGDVLVRLYKHERARLAQIDLANRRADDYDAAGQALLDGLVTVDASGRIEWCNRAAETMLGLDREADLGQPIANLVRHPEFVSYLQVAQFGKPFAMRAPVDEARTLLLNVVQYGERRMLQMRDITERERVDAMRRDFVANVSHELRTPLTVLAGFVETLQDLDLDAEERRQYLDMMADQAGRMQRLLAELLMLSNLESAPPPPATERVDMLALCQKLLRDGEALSAGRHTLALDIEGQADLLGSEFEITSALGNLVSNAVRYTPAGGRIRIVWRTEGKTAEFAVEDNGIGIDPKYIPRLTERFYRVDRGRSRETGGTGLGLAIVKHTLSRHQATLDIQSAPGKGSRFAARFPAARVVL